MFESIFRSANSLKLIFIIDIFLNLYNSVYWNTFTEEAASIFIGLSVKYN